MHPTNFLGCNSRTLPFLILAGAPGPAGLQSARSRAGPASQDSGFCPLDFQRTLGCLGNPRRLGDFSAEGWSGKGLDPKGEAFLRPPGGGAPRMCQQRAEYVVPCSTQSQCPDPWSAPLRCAHWMPILGDPGAHEMGVPSRKYSGLISFRIEFRFNLLAVQGTLKSLLQHHSSKAPILHRSAFFMVQLSHP